MPDPNDPLEAFYAAHPELRPGSAGGNLVAKTLGATPQASPKAPAGPPPPPQGFVEVSPGRAVGNNGLTQMMLNPTTHQWETSTYAPNAADKAAAGVKTGSSTTNYNDIKSQTQQTQGASTSLPPGAILVAPTRAIGSDRLTVLTKDSTTGNWVNSGFPPNQADKAAAARSILAQTQSGNPSPTQTSTQPQSSSPSPGFGPVVNPITPSQAPSFQSERLQSAVNPGLQQSQTDMRTLPLGNALNQIAIHNPNNGFNGFINKDPGTTGPRSLGYGPGVSNNTFTFSQRDSGFTQPGNPFPNMSYSVPKDWNPTTGMNDQGFFSPLSIGFNVSNPNIDPGLGPISQGGMGTLQLNGPQTANISASDKSWGMGFNPNALPASNIGLAYGRDFSGMNPAAQAVATLALLDQQMQAQEQAGGGLYGGGYGPDGGQRGFAGGGVITARPLGAASSGPKSMVTPEQIYLVGNSGKVYGTVGEDNSDPNSAPNPELLSFPNNDQMKVTPLTPAFADGGWITSGGMGGWGDPVPQPQPVPEPVQPPPVISAPSFSSGIGSSNGGFGQSVQPVPTPAPIPAPAPVPVPTYAPPPIDTVAPIQPSAPVNPPFVPHLDQPVDPGSGFGSSGGGFSQPTNPIDQPSGGLGPSIPVAPTQPTSGFGGPVPTGGLSGPGTPTPVPTTPTPTTPTTPAAPVAPPSFNPLPVPVPNGQAPTDLFDPNILLPWQQAAQRLALQTNQRGQYDYRRRAAGLGSATAVPVLSGDVPNQELPPGMYYDPSGQVNRVISDILGTQSEIQALGPTEDITPVQQQVSDIGHYLDAMQKIRDLELQRTGAEANAAAPNQTADTSNLQAELNALQQRASDAYQTTPPGPARDAYLADLARQEAALQHQIDSAQSNVPQALDRVSVINSEIAALQSSLPANTSEAALLTELARAKERLSRNDRRLYLSQQAQNLSKLGVPNLTSPIAA